MTTLRFGGILGEEDFRVEIPDGSGKLQIVGPPGAKRIVGRGDYRLSLASEPFRLEWAALSAGADPTADLTVVEEFTAGGGREYRVVAGEVRARLGEPSAGGFPLDVAPGTVVRLTPNGMIVDGVETAGSQAAVAIWNGAFRPTPDALPDLVPIPRPPATDWSFWRRGGSGREDGSWEAWLEATVPIELGAGAALILQVTRVQWNAADGELVLVETAEDAPFPYAGKPTLVLERRGSGWVPREADIGRLRPVAAEPDRPPEAATRLWLRGANRSWVAIGAGVPVLARVEERRTCVIAGAAMLGAEAPPRFPDDATAGGFRIELLPDGTERIEVVLGPDRETAREIRLFGPALRLTLPAAAYRASDLAWPAYPPAEAALPPQDSVWLTDRAGDGAPAPVRLHASKAGEWQLVANAGAVTHFRRVRTPFDTPPAWAANDPAATVQPSPLRGLFPFVNEGPAVLALGTGAVAVRGADRLERVAEPGRPAFGLMEERLGLELQGKDPKGIAFRDRHAVAALDELYRGPAESLGPKTELLPLAATYVEDRFVEDREPEALRASSVDPFDGPLPTEDVDVEEEAAWGAPELFPLVSMGRNLGCRLVLERFAGGGVRRWGVLGDVRLAGIWMEPRDLSSEGDVHTLVLQTRPAAAALPTEAADAAAFLGEIRLRIAAPEPDGSREVSITGPAWLRIPPEAVLDPARGPAVGVIEGRDLVLQGVELRMGTLDLWRGNAPDQSRVRLAGVWAIVTAADEGDGADGPPERPRVRLQRADAAAEGPVRLDVSDETLLGLHLDHVLVPGLVLRETVVGPSTEVPGAPGFELRFGDGEAVKVVPAEIRSHGHRCLVAWAGALEGPEAALMDGVGVTALTRVFLELSRTDSSDLEIVGGMIGWTAGWLFGLQPAADVEFDRPFPHVTLTWPAREPAPDTDPAPPVLELNGTWWHRHKGDSGRFHELRVHCWDAELVTTGRKRPALRAEQRLRVLVEHTLSVGLEKSLRGFAFHTAEIVKGLADLSAVLFAEARLREPTEIHAGGLKRRALKGFVVDLAPPLRFRGGGEGDTLLLLLRCGPRWKEKMGGSRSAEEVHDSPPLAWASGVRFLDSPAEAWRTEAPIPGDAAASAGPGAWVYGRDPGDAFTHGAPAYGIEGSVLLSSLARRDSLPEWLPCPVRGELDFREEARPPRIWVVGGRGLALLHTFDRVLAEEELTEQTRRIIVRSGWHREAVLETWREEVVGERVRSTPTWTLVDSPLLNRSIALGRFTGDVEPMAARLRGTSRATSTLGLSDVRVEGGSLSLERHGTDGSLVIRGFPDDRAASAAGLEILRDVPFAVDAGKSPLRGRLRAGGASSAGTFGGVWGGGPERTGHPFAPQEIVLHPSRSRPGERVRIGAAAWLQDSQGLSPAGGRSREFRTGVWTRGSLELSPPRRLPGDREGVLIREDLVWRAEPVGGRRERHTLDPERSLVLLHAPAARQAHPADPVQLWLFLPAAASSMAGESMPRVTLKLKAALPSAGEPTGEAPHVALRGDWFGPDDALLRTVELRLPAAELIGPGVNPIPAELPKEAVRAVFTLRLPERGVDWSAEPKAALLLELERATAPEGTTLLLDPGSARASSSLGLVGLVSRFGGGEDPDERLVAYGPEPPGRWSPVRIAASPAVVEWQRIVRWTDRRALGDPPVHHLFYIEPSGAFIASRPVAS